MHLYKEMPWYRFWFMEASNLLKQDKINKPKNSTKSIKGRELKQIIPKQIYPI